MKDTFKKLEKKIDGCPIWKIGIFLRAIMKVGNWKLEVRKRVSKKKHLSRTIHYCSNSLSLYLTIVKDQIQLLWFWLGVFQDKRLPFLQHWPFYQTRSERSLRGCLLSSLSCFRHPLHSSTISGMQLPICNPRKAVQHSWGENKGYGLSLLQSSS